MKHLKGTPYDVELGASRLLKWAERNDYLPTRDELMWLWQLGASTSSKLLERVLAERPKLMQLRSREKRAKAFHRFCSGASQDGPRKGPEQAPGVQWRKVGESAMTFSAKLQELGDFEQLLANAGVDLEAWAIAEASMTHHEAFRKHEKKDIEFTEGVIHGWSQDYGDIFIQPLFNIRVKLKPRRTGRQLKAMGQTWQQLIAESANQEAPKLNRDVQPSALVAGERLLELVVPDVHFGKLAWGEETGEDWDLKIAREAYQSAVNELIAIAKTLSPDQIVLPIGNDLLHVDGPANSTTAGTYMDVDSRWQKAYREAFEALIWTVEVLRNVAPVHIVPVPGNHAEVLEHTLGVGIWAYFQNDKRITVDQSVRNRKYYSWGKVLLGFTHGHEAPPSTLPMAMAREVPELWAQSRVREWHLGHLHHKRVRSQPGERLELLEEDAVVLRWLSSLCAADNYHARKALTGNVKAATAFLWHKDGRMLGQFYGYP